MNGYLTDKIIRYHKHNLSNNYVQYKDYKVSLPKYYRERIYITDQEKQDFYKHMIKIENEEKKARNPITSKNLMV